MTTGADLHALRPQETPPPPPEDRLLLLSLPLATTVQVELPLALNLQPDLNTKILTRDHVHHVVTLSETSLHEIHPRPTKTMPHRQALVPLPVQEEDDHRWVLAHLLHLVQTRLLLLLLVLVVLPVTLSPHQALSVVEPRLHIALQAIDPRMPLLASKAQPLPHLLLPRLLRHLLPL